ncbi:hypothetical protein [Sphaerisporangium aureirubrum]|uniref:DUF2631 domain-containing protein n=1 Tax=Sphaerisporangium aureirubrum TaxID=1544736 RepID=A0ABW1NBK0_9ACTN
MRPDAREIGPDGAPVKKERRYWHRTDWLSLFSGLLFVGIGVRYLVEPAPDALTMLLSLVFGLGFAGFFAVIARVSRKR